MLVVHDLEHEEGEGPKHRSVQSALFWILVMNIVFSFDTVLSAVALTKIISSSWRRPLCCRAC